MCIALAMFFSGNRHPREKERVGVLIVCPKSGEQTECIWNYVRSFDSDLNLRRYIAKVLHYDFMVFTPSYFLVQFVFNENMLY
jgi:hypothetical protein